MLYCVGKIGVLPSVRYLCKTGLLCHGGDDLTLGPPERSPEVLRLLRLVCPAGRSVNLRQLFPAAFRGGGRDRGVEFLEVGAPLTVVVVKVDHVDKAVAPNDVFR